MKESLFITFEGGEGSGKTTQSKKLVNYFKDQGREAIWTREIGGTDLAEEIRDIIVNKEMHIKTELLLALAARIEHYNDVIKPALDKGSIVVCDRFVDSSLAYQGKDLGIDYVLEIHQKLFGELMPDITFLIDVPIEVALKRAMERGNNNRFELMPQEHHIRVKDCFYAIAKKFQDRVNIVDGNRDPENVFKDILSKIKEKGI